MEIIQEQVLDEIGNLLSLQKEILNHNLDTGHDANQALSVTVHLVEDNLYFTKSKTLRFRSFPDYNDVKHDKEIARKKRWQEVWHNKRFHNVQRKCELPRVKGQQRGWQDIDHDDKV